MRAVGILMALQVLVLAGLAPGDAVASSEMDARVTLLQPAIINAEQVSDLLLSSATGVLTIRFPSLMTSSPNAPETVQSGGITLSGLKVHRAGGTYTFSVGTENAQELDRIVSQLALPSDGIPVDGAGTLSAQGYIDGKGFQMAVVQIIRTPEGGGYIRAIIPFN